MIELLKRLLTFEIWNTSEEDAPPFACMELDYAYESGKSAFVIIDGPRLILRVKKPTADNLSNQERFIFNGPFKIDADGYGYAAKLPIIQCLMDLDIIPDPGTACGPADDSWLISTTGSGYVVKSVDSAKAYEDGDTKTVFVEAVGSGGSIKYAYPPPGGIPAATWNSTTKEMTPGKVSCRIAESSGGVYSPSDTSELVENPVEAVVGLSGKPITIGPTSYGTWTVLVEDCTGSDDGGGPNPEPPIPDAVNGGTSKGIDMGYSMGV